MKKSSVGKDDWLVKVYLDAKLHLATQDKINAAVDAKEGITLTASEAKCMYCWRQATLKKEKGKL